MKKIILLLFIPIIIFIVYGLKKQQISVINKNTTNTTDNSFDEVDYRKKLIKEKSLLTKKNDSDVIINKFDARETSASIICKIIVTQPVCYNNDYPSPEISWEYCKNNNTFIQDNYQIQISKDHYQNSSFATVDIDTDIVESERKSYEVATKGLSFDSIYFLGLTINKEIDEKIGWWGWGENGFITSPACE